MNFIDEMVVAFLMAVDGRNETYGGGIAVAQELADAILDAATSRDYAAGYMP